jgi:hypothetical protein
MLSDPHQFSGEHIMVLIPMKDTIISGESYDGGMVIMMVGCDVNTGTLLILQLQISHMPMLPQMGGKIISISLSAGMVSIQDELVYKILI